jgi:guanyl-specific ribonuclease Sa
MLVAASLTPAIRCNQTLGGGTTPRIPRLNVSQLLRCRPEVQTTINAIKRNGPFRYDQDDTVFANREGILPTRPNGTYHEYTVVTPGASTRGTRRIITAGRPRRNPADFTSIYYTDDHYQTVWLLQGN